MLSSAVGARRPTLCIARAGPPSTPPFSRSCSSAIMPAAAQPEGADPRGWVVALVGSAGALAVMGAIREALPGSLPAAVVVLLHLPPGHHSRLPAILAGQSTLRVKTAEDGDRLQPGCVYVAPPDVHLLVHVD